MSDSSANEYSCPRCTVGRCYHKTTTFVEIFQGQLLCVPDVPVYICDICNFAEFELDAIEALWAELDADNMLEDYQPSSETTYFSPFGK